MTAVQIAQKAAHMVVALNVSAAVETQLENHTDIDTDSIAVQVGSMVVGQVVANKTDRFTDPIVEKTVLFVQTHRPKINFRKSKES
jgi:hypothetical protein